MKKMVKKLFEFGDKEQLQIDSKSSDVVMLQSFLANFGHLRGSYQPGCYCRDTERAVRRYQRYFGLKTDGIAGDVTKKHMMMPRCGVPDHPVSHDGALTGAPYALRGCKYDLDWLTYAFLNTTGDLSGAREREIVKQAFAAWAGVANIRFREVQPDEDPNLRIAWRKGNHGDGSAFDGPGNTLAHAFFPPPCGGLHSGDLHFDEDELWTESASDGGILLLAVAIHEIGHLLGLSHSDEQTAIMYPYYSSERISLAQDDIDGVQELYGEKKASEKILLTNENSGTLLRTADEALFEVSVPQTLALSIEGPANADFDLYVKKDSPPTVDEWDYRAWTVSSDERIVFPAEQGAKYHIMVRSYEGAGDYKLKVEPG